MGSLTSPNGSASGLRLNDRRICLPVALRPYPGTTTARYSYPPASPHQLAYYRIGPRPPRATPKGSPLPALSISDSARAVSRGYGNINPLSIDYACRPRLRSRLTLGGLACPRNPWSSGGRVSHSSLATHACILTRDASTAGFPRRFTRDTTLPYPATPKGHCHGFGGMLEPRYIVGAESLDQ
jgi:hypothetical protein